MKRCPFCAEEIQDEAIVCKHCGRDLAGGASQVQIVQPKKKTGCFTWGCLVLIVLGGIGFIGSLLGGRSTTSETASTPTTTQAAKPAREGKGKFQKYAYTFKTGATKPGRDATIFLFEPELPPDDALVLAAMQHVLVTDFGITLNRATTRPAAPALRFITADGVFDVTPAKNTSTGRWMGLAVMRVP